MNNVDKLIGAWLVSLLAAFVAVPVLAQNQNFEYGMGLKAQVPFVASGTITLDGTADEAAWADAHVIDPTAFWDGAWSGHPDADVAATAKLLHTDGMLYVYIEVEDYDVWVDAENPGQSDQILLGVDLVHDPGVTDVQTDGDFAGFVANAPDLGPVTYKIAHGLGVTLNWDTAANPDPAAQGWVQGTTFLDEVTLVWGAELAIVNPAVTPGGEVGFNLGLGLAKEEGAGDRGEATYAFSSWVVCNPDLLDDELWCGPGGTVMSDAHSFATLELLPNGAMPYGTGLAINVPSVDAGAITLDGTGDEAEWANAQMIDPTAQWDGAWSGHPEADVAATAKLLHSDGMLYVYIEVEDYDVWVDAENPGQSDQILLGVDLVHTPGVTDIQTDGDFAGFVANAPDQGPVTYKIAHGLGVTLNWDTAANPDPAAQGWVQGATFLDEVTLVWGAELAIANAAVTEGAQIGFNLGLGLAKEEGAGDRGEATYAFSSWVVCNPDILDDELWCGPGGTVMSDAHSFATLDLVASTGTAVEPIAGSEVPSEYALEQNYPNPFNPSTTIEYAVPSAGVVTVGIYNTLGQRVLGVVDQHLQAGRYRVTMDAHNLPSGLYIYRLQVDGRVVMAKTMTLVK